MWYVVGSVTQIFLIQVFLNDFIKYYFFQKKKIYFTKIGPYGTLCWHLCRKICSFHNSVVDIGRLFSSVDFEHCCSSFSYILYAACVIESYFSKCQLLSISFIGKLGMNCSERRFLVCLEDKSSLVNSPNRFTVEKLAAVKFTWLQMVFENIQWTEIYAHELEKDNERFSILKPCFSFNASELSYFRINRILT